MQNNSPPEIKARDSSSDIAVACFAQFLFQVHSLVKVFGIDFGDWQAALPEVAGEFEECAILAAVRIQDADRRSGRRREAEELSGPPGTGTQQQPGGKFDTAGRLGRKNWIHLGSPEAGPKMAAILSVVESCRRMRIAVREYLGAVLPGLAAVRVQRVAELTPAAWAARNQ